jgi:hypothetical protein
VAAPKKSPKLTAAKTRSLPTESFALPGKGKANVKGAKGAYPIDTPGRAQNALGKAKRFANPAEQATIRKRVAAKYPGMKVTNPTKKK